MKLGPSRIGLAGCAALLAANVALAQEGFLVPPWPNALSPNTTAAGRDAQEGRLDWAALLPDAGLGESDDERAPTVSVRSASPSTPPLDEKKDPDPSRSDAAARVPSELEERALRAEALASPFLAEKTPWLPPRTDGLVDPWQREAAAEKTFEDGLLVAPWR